MKHSKKKTFKPAKLVIMLILIIFIISGLSFINYNRSKPSISAETFVETMKNKNFSITDLADKYSDYGYVEHAYIAINSDFTYQIEFYSLSDIAKGKEFYKEKKAELKSSRRKGESKKGNDYRYYGKFILSSDDQYKQLYRINDTVVYIDTRTKYKDEVLNVLAELGY